MTALERAVEAAEAKAGEVDLAGVEVGKVTTDEVYRAGGWPSWHAFRVALAKSEPALRRRVRESETLPAGTDYEPAGRRRVTGTLLMRLVRDIEAAPMDEAATRLLRARTDAALRDLAERRAARRAAAAKSGGDLAGDAAALAVAERERDRLAALAGRYGLEVADAASGG